VGGWWLGGGAGLTGGGGRRGGGRTLPVVIGSSWVAAPVSAVDWNRSPSRVELSQPLSHRRYAAVASRTRVALAPIGVFPRRPGIGSRSSRRKHATRRASPQTSSAKLGDEG